jgi:molybdopterin/thiamine biosynthesis adenylyltransferase/rhodanese-related sulfurtransferase
MPSAPDPDAPPARRGLTLSPAELARYRRHLVLPGVGESGQRRLAAARVLVVGAGGLGSPVAMYLAAAGVGHIGIVDDDRVDLSNLHRQLLHATNDVGRAKTDSARDRLAGINPHVDVATYETRLASANALDILRGHDVVVDGTDNFPTRYLVNDACVLLGIPNVHGSIARFEGQASVFAAPDGPCYRCLFPEPPPPGLVPSCAEGGVFGVLPGLVGTIQATETLKLLLGIGEPLVGRLLLLDALRMTTRTIALRRDPACPACGTRELRELIDYDAFCAGPAPSTAPSAVDDGRDEITVRELAERLRRGDALELIDVREPWEHAYARIPGARLLPLGALAEAIPSLDRSREYVLHCHHGVRSRQAAEMLRAAGFRRVRNLAGGIAAWSAEVDPAVPSY